VPCLAVGRLCEKKKKNYAQSRKAAKAVRRGGLDFKAT